MKKLLTILWLMIVAGSIFIASHFLKLENNEVDSSISTVENIKEDAESKEKVSKEDHKTEGQPNFKEEEEEEDNTEVEEDDDQARQIEQLTRKVREVEERYNNYTDKLDTQENKVDELETLRDDILAAKRLNQRCWSKKHFEAFESFSGTFNFDIFALTCI